ncbi:hypothetical protein ALC56_11416 [Trachymyrmex septentrionalis]|uniref:Uncharacterized protein n=1 Tax=Trachymyrmex septentrionalis TaxID=34720 RepID=A0A195F2J1_9HYME|nr:hypothetical protein ALC56_11416 [Trachymyrmex septentrionalis]
MLRGFIFSPPHTANVSRGKCGQSLAKDNRRASGGADIGALATVNSPDSEKNYALTEGLSLAKCFASYNSRLLERITRALRQQLQFAEPLTPRYPGDVYATETDVDHDGVMVTFGFRKIVQADSVPRETCEKLRLAQLHSSMERSSDGKIFPEYTTNFPRDSPFRKAFVAAVILFSSSRGLSHTPTAPKGGETSAGISKFVRVLGVSGSTGLSSSSSFRRASLREPQQQCSTVVQSRECAMEYVAERMLRSRGEKGDCEDITIRPCWITDFDFLPDNTDSLIWHSTQTDKRVPYNCICTFARQRR